MFVYKLFWDSCIPDDMFLSVDCPCLRCQWQFRSSRCGRASLPSPGLQVQEGFDFFPWGSEMEGTNPAGSMGNELMKNCKALSEPETLRNVTATPSQSPWNQAGSSTFICSGRVGPELTPYCSTNFSRAPQYFLLTLQGHFEFGPCTIRTQEPSQDQQFAQPGTFCWMWMTAQSSLLAQWEPEKVQKHEQNH